MLAGQRRRQADVLVGQAQREVRWLVLASEELLGQPVVEALTAVRALPYRMPQGSWLHAGLHAQRKHLGQGGLHGVAGAVVDELGHGAGANRAHADDLITHGVQYGLVFAEDRLVPADPDRHLARARAPRPATHRRVEDMDTSRGEE